MAEHVVLDTNVTISALLWRGAPYRVVLLAKAKVIQALYCDEMLAELTEKLREKIRFDESRIHAIIYQIRQYAERVEIAGTLHFVRDDPDDDKFIECAVVGKASWIISGDQHLLGLSEYQDIHMVTAEDFLSKFDDDEEEHETEADE